MKTLIVGHKGFIGQALLEYIHENNLTSFVLVFERDTNGGSIHRIAIPTTHFSDNGISFAECRAEDLFEIETVIYFSGVYDIMKRNPNSSSEDLINLHFEKNVIQVFLDISRFIAEAKNLKQVIFVSSQSVNRALDLSKKDNIMIEDLVYGLNKFLTERLIAFLTQAHSASVLSARIGTVYGPGEPTHRLATQALMSFTQGKEFVVSNSNHLKNYIYVRDLVRILWNLREINHQAKDSTLNISGIQTFTVKDYVISLAKHWEISTSSSAQFLFAEDPNYSGDLLMLNDYYKPIEYTSLHLATKKMVEHFLQSKNS